MTDFFQFEADFVDSLRCIPMQVRFFARYLWHV